MSTYKNIEELGCLLIKLLQACQAYSMDDVDEAMEEIDKFEYDSDDGLVKWLREKVATMKFTEIIDKITQITS